MSEKTLKRKMEFVPQGDNEVLRGDGFYISFNQNTSATKSGLGDLFNKMGGLLANMIDYTIETDGRAETALVKEGVFYILNGDFRIAYKKIAPKGYTACLRFFISKKENWSHWSTLHKYNGMDKLK